MSMSYQSMSSPANDSRSESLPSILTLRFIGYTDGDPIELKPSMEVVCEGEWKQQVRDVAYMAIPGCVRMESGDLLHERTDEDGRYRADLTLCYLTASYYDLPPYERNLAPSNEPVSFWRKHESRLREIGTYLVSLALSLIVALTLVGGSIAVYNYINQRTYDAALRESEMKMKYGVGDSAAFDQIMVDQQAHQDAIRREVMNSLATPVGQKDPDFDPYEVESEVNSGMLPIEFVDGGIIDNGIPPATNKIPVTDMPNSLR